MTGVLGARLLTVHNEQLQQIEVLYCNCYGRIFFNSSFLFAVFANDCLFRYRRKEAMTVLLIKQYIVGDPRLNWVEYSTYILLARIKGDLLSWFDRLRVLVLLRGCLVCSSRAVSLRLSGNFSSRTGIHDEFADECAEEDQTYEYRGDDARVLSIEACG